MNHKEDLTLEGIHKIAGIRSSLNKGGGLSDELKEAFPNVIPVLRPLVEIPANISPS
jgi:hypothetical protein